MAQDNSLIPSPEELASKIAMETLKQQQAYLENLMKLPTLPTSAWDIMQASEGKYDLAKAVKLADRNLLLNRQKEDARRAAIEKMIALEDQTGIRVDPETGKGEKIKEELIPLSAWKGYQEYQKTFNKLFRQMARSDSAISDLIAQLLLYNKSLGTGQVWGERPLEDWQKTLVYGR